MTTAGASSRPEPEGEGKESWSPKEPNRPLLPKPWAFGMSYSKPLDDLPVAGKKSADPMPEPPPEEDNGSPDKP